MLKTRSMETFLFLLELGTFSHLTSKGICGYLQKTSVGQSWPCLLLSSCVLFIVILIFDCQLKFMTTMCVVSY